MRRSPVSAPAEPTSDAHIDEPEKLDLTKRLTDLDEQRLAGLSDGELVATINQRRYFADLKLQDEWKRRKQKQRKPLRFKRPPRM